MQYRTRDGAGMPSSAVLELLELLELLASLAMYSSMCFWTRSSNRSSPIGVSIASCVSSGLVFTQRRCSAVVPDARLRSAVNTNATNQTSVSAWNWS